MKDGLIRLTDEKNLFYDSIEKLYRVRMHCPYCGKESGCRCFDTLKKAENFLVDGDHFLCSSKCFINEHYIEDVMDTMKDMGIKWRLKWYIFKYTGYISEKDAYKVIDTMEVDFDSVQGESC